MASGGYFGFTHGGTQYSAQPATGSYAAQPAQHTGYVHAQQAHQAPAYATATAAPRAASTATVYEANYQPTHAAGGGYTYGATQRQDAAQVVSTPAFRETYASSYGQASATPTYEKQTYYQPQTTQQHSSTDGYYAAPVSVKASAAYSSGSGFGTHQPAPAKIVQHPKTVAASYTFSIPTTVTTYTTTAATTYTTGGSTYSGYDAAVYSAATNYYQQQQQVAKGSQPWQNKNKNQFGKPVKKDRQPPKQPQIHYCEVCKISCAGPQTYREHLEGQKHKKKEAQLKTGTPIPSQRIGTHSLRCELCDVTCTGQDAYNAHIRGSKHQKVLKLHTKLGKPIPSTEPVKVGGSSTTTTASGSKAAAMKTTASTASFGSSVGANAAQKPKVVTKQLTTPKIAFVGGTKLMTAATDAEKKQAAESKAAGNQATPTATSPVPALTDNKMAEEFFEQEITPVGEDYVEEVKNETGKVISFNCKLCECKFNDPNAKEMHMKGRRHRLQYKKKVDPKYQVEVKPTARVRKFHEEKLRRQMAKDEFLRRRDEEMRVQVEMRRYEEDVYWRRFEEERFMEERLQYEEEMEFFEWQRRRGIPHPRPVPPKPPMMQDMMTKRPDTVIDRHVMAKHASIYPTEQELAAVQNIVTCCEKSLKLVSDYISDADNPGVPMEEVQTTTTEVKKVEVEETTTEEKEENKEETKKEEEKEPANPRALKGVMRVGVLAKGLLLRGDLNMSLVVLCSEKPTRTLLERVADNLPKRLAETEGKFDIKLCVEEAAIIVFTTDQEIKTSIKILLSSPAMRETASETTKDPPDVLDRQKCLDALAALRHAKWFQARANCLQSCVIIIRVLRDLCERIPTWSPLNGWPMELLCERVIASAGQPLTPGESLRRIFEAIAGGIILPGGPGMYDPCEKDATDAFGHLTNQQREDITASAQHALRLIVFRQVHKVLGMEPLPPPQRNSTKTNRKRRRDDSEGGDKEPVDGKKDKKEGVENAGSAVDMATTEGASSSSSSQETK